MRSGSASCKSWRRAGSRRNKPSRSLKDANLLHAGPWVGSAANPGLPRGIPDDHANQKPVAQHLVRSLVVSIRRALEPTQSYRAAGRTPAGGEHRSGTADRRRVGQPDYRRRDHRRAIVHRRFVTCIARNFLIARPLRALLIIRRLDMPLKEERMQILRMIQNGQISAEEGAKLLAALDEGKRSEAAANVAATQGKFLRVRVTDMSSGRTKVNVNVPLALVNVGL